MKTFLLLILSVIFGFVFVAAESQERRDELKIITFGQDYVDVIDLALKTGSALEWSPVRQIGNLINSSHEIAFRVGTPWVLVDRSFSVYVGDIIRQTGAVLITAKGADTIIRLLQSETKKPIRRIEAILIDPGHGGKDPGASGSYQSNGENIEVIEKEVVLETAQILFDILSKRFPDKQIVLTRNDDSYVTLEGRTDIANNLIDQTEDSVIFVSIHANASLDTKARGFEVWYLPPDYRRELITADNLDDDARELAPILNTMLEEEYTRESILLAQEIIQEFDRRVGNKSINRGIREESWFVVRNAKMPAVLVELGFATNEQEAALLASSGYLRTLAEGVYSAIETFVTTFESTDGFSP